MRLVCFLPGEKAQSSKTTADAGKDVPLASPSTRDADKQATSDVPLSGGPSKEPETKEAASGFAEGQSQDALHVDEFNAMDIASDIAKEVVKEVGGSSGQLETPKEVEGSEEKAATTNKEPAQEIDSPAGSPRADLFLHDPSLVKDVAPRRKKKKLAKKAVAPSSSSSHERTPSPLREEDVVDIPSSTEKSIPDPDPVFESNVSESSDMDDLAEGSEGSEESEDVSGGSQGKSSSDVFAGIGDIVRLPSFTPSKLLTSSHPSDSEPLRESEDQGEKLPYEKVSSDADLGKKLPEDQGNGSQSQAREEASGPGLSKHSLFPDAQGVPRWSVWARNVPILRVIQEHFPLTFANFSASRLVGGSLLDVLGGIVLSLQETSVRDFSEEKYEDMTSSITDMETFGLDLQWLRDRLEQVRSTKLLSASLFKIQASEAQIAEAKETYEKYKQLLADAKEKVSALKEGHKLLLEDHKALEAIPKISLTDAEPVLPSSDLFSQKFVK